MDDDLLGFQFIIEGTEKSSMANGEEAHIIYLVIDGQHK